MKNLENLKKWKKSIEEEDNTWLIIFIIGVVLGNLGYDLDLERTMAVGSAITMASIVWILGEFITSIILDHKIKKIEGRK